MTWRLGLRLARGADRAGSVRLALLSAGIAVAVFTVLCSLALPRALGAQVDRSAARLPVSAAPGQPGTFLYRIAEDQLAGRIASSVTLAATSPAAPAPPGLTRQPAPGEVFLSPALAALRGSTDPLIGPAGLAGPDDLLEYRGVTPAELAGESGTGRGFGAPRSFIGEPPVLRVAMTLVLLVVLPAGVFLVTSARLSSATRLQRLAALRLLGVRRDGVVRLAAIETSVAGALGAVGGLLLYVLLLPAVAASPLFGTTWFPADTRLTPALALVVLVTVTAGSAVLGSRGMARALDRPLEARREPEHHATSWRGWAMLLTGSVVLAAFAVLPSFGRRPEVGSGTAIQFVVAASALTLTGFVLLLRPILVRLSRRLGESTSLAPRLAGRRLAVDGASTARVLAGLVVLCLVAGAGSGVLRDAELAVNVPIRELLVSVTTSASTPTQTVARLAALDAEAFVGLTRVQGSRAGRAEAVAVIAATCASLDAVGSVEQGTCQQGQTYRLLPAENFPGEPLLGLSLEPDSPAPEQVLAVSDETGVLPPAGGLLVTDIGALAGRWAPGSDLTFVTADPAEADALRTAVRVIDPASRSDGGVDPVTLATFQLLDSTGRTGLATGFALAVLTFLVAAADRSRERRPNVAALSVVGVPIRLLRRVQVLQLLVPLAVVVGAALAVGNLIGLAWLGGGGLERTGLYTGGLALSAVMLVVAIGLAVTAGALTVRRGIATEHLRRV